MKYFITLLAFLFCLNNSSSQWNFIQIPPTVDLNSISFPNIYTGTGVGAVSGTLQCILRTTNGGVNWFSQGSPSSGKLYGVWFINGNTGWASGTGVIIHTTDGGNNWVLQQPGVSTWLNDIAFANQNTGAAVGQFGKILVTSNGGNNWTVNTFGSTFFIGVSFLNENTGAAVGTSGTIIKTTNGGINWTPYNFATTSRLNSIAFIDANNIFAVGSVNGIIIRSTNGGINWSVVQSGTPGLYDIFFINSLTGYIPGDGGTILKTTNGGTVWFYDFNPSAGSNLSVVFPDSSQGWVSGKGTLMHYGNLIGIQQVSNEIPADFNLYQNYPNPFNPTTKIKFSIPMDSRIRGNDKVVLKIYDGLGKEVQTLVNEQLNPGTYEVKWDAAKYSSGVYFYRLVSGNYVNSKKMLLIK